MKILFSLFGVSALMVGAFWGTPLTYVAPPLPLYVEPYKETPSKVTLLFGGDVMLSRGIGSVMRKRNDFAYPFRSVAELVRAADIAVVNLESPISSRGKNIGSIYSFRADPRAVEGLTHAGIDVVTLANNHAGDYGADALLDTFEIVRSKGIAVVGAGENMRAARTPVFRYVDGIRIAFLGYTPIAPAWLTSTSSAPAVAPFDEKLIKEDIAAAVTAGADIVAVLLHWGNEYETTHTPQQQALARTLIDSGATLVIGHHPHVVQGVERYKGGVIAYSLGNFVFDQNFSEDTRHGLLLKVVLHDGQISEVKEIPIRFSDSYQPYVVDGKAATAVTL